MLLGYRTAYSGMTGTTAPSRTVGPSTVKPPAASSVTRCWSPSGRMTATASVVSTAQRRSSTGCPSEAEIPSEAVPRRRSES